MNRLTSAFAIVLLLLACNTEKTKRKEKVVSFESPKNLFINYISAYTSGVISSSSVIKIKLAKSAENVKAGDEAKADLFSFEPDIEGSASWEDNRTVVFHPEKPLTNGTHYFATFAVSEVLEKSDVEDFKFTFKAIPQNFDIEVTGISIYDSKDLSQVKLTGVLQTADEITNNAAEQLVSANQSTNKLALSWDHNTTGNKHTFTIEKVKRTKSEGEVTIEWDGSPIDVDKKGKLQYSIPSLDDYKVVSVNVIRGEESYISVLFSDPIDEKQNLKGFISFGSNNPRYVVDQNQLKLYPTAEVFGSQRLKIIKSIKNSAGYALKDDYTVNVEMSQIKPEVKLAANSGAVIPNSQGLIVPFEAVGLKAVDVTILQIFENNVLQYLQSNRLGNQSNLNRVGRPVARKTINLAESGVTNLQKWNRYTLDLAEMFKIQSGSIYQIQLSFRKGQSLYFCPNDDQDKELASSNEADWDLLEESSNWDNYENYYYNNYNWEDRKNPCKVAFYYQQQKVKKVVFASDLGLIAKRGDRGDLKVFITNMIDTKPIADASLAIYDFQQQVIGSGLTNSNGEATISLKRKPYFLFAKSGDQFGYLKIDDGSSLSLSNFNVAGSKIQKGMKGFIYGERGVWRPGDDIHLTFILEDKTKSLPESYPVIIELRNPQGQVVEKKVNTESLNNTFYFALSTDEQAPTGNWKAVVKAGGATFSKRLKIESVKANRLKIDLDFGKEKLSALDDRVSGELNVKWLHGAKAKNLRAEFELLVVPTKTKFEKYPNHSFDDNSKEFYVENDIIFDGKLNSEGYANVNFQLETDINSPGALSAIFKGKVYEEGGEFSIDKFSIPYYPYKSFVGLNTPEGDRRGMLLTDQDHAVNIVSVDANGKPVNRSKVKVELFKLNWRWWWDNSSDNLSSYVGRSHRSPIQKGYINTSNGRGEWKLNVKYPDWGRYYVKVTDPISGHSAGKIIYMDWPGWAGKGKKEMGGANMLDFTVEKEEYKVGEKVKLSIPSSVGSRVLISLESGKEILQTFWVETKDESTSVEFECTADMAPNIYANVTLIQPHSQTANDLPIRMYGIQSISVTDPATQLEPMLNMPAEIRPEQNFKIEVSEKNDNPMTYTIAMVDEGLLDLTRFGTPSPWETFYAREALGIKTWDIYDDVIGAYGGAIERLLAVGGDGDLKAPDGKKANRFKPVVSFLGPFYLESGESTTHEIKMPQYIGSVRTMIVASNEGAYGSSDVTTPVKQPLMVLATLPRVAGPGEDLKLPITIFTTDNGIKTVDIEVKAEGKLKVIGDAKQKVSFTEQGESVIYFKMKAAESLGYGKVSVNATAGSLKAKYDIELNVRASNPMFTDVQDKLITSGESWDVSYEPLGMFGTNSALIEVSSLPPLNLEQRLQYLIRYPHGCIEQTTSSVFAQLYLDELISLDDERKLQIEKNINAAIERLKLFQTASGGFAYWPGQSDANDWGTNYAGHFLLEARKKGFAVSEGLINSLIVFQSKKANNWSRIDKYSAELNQAYRLYMMALAGEPMLGAMNRLKAQTELTHVAKWKLALAYATAGYKDIANELIQGLSKDVVSYKGSHRTYGSKNRDKAIILETLARLDKVEDAYDILVQISEEMGNKDKWMSTQTTAYCLIGIATYSQGNQKSPDLNFSANIGSTVASYEKGKYVTQLAIEEADKKAPINLKNNGDTPIYTRLVRNGIPLEGNEVERSKNISMKINYKDLDGNILNVSSIEQGTDFIAEVMIHNPGTKGNYNEIALTQIFPSGWEILNTRLDNTSQYYKQEKPEYTDIRDDRVLMYFDIKANERKTFVVRLNASYQGKYYLPSISLEAMYDNSIYANSTGKWVSVVGQ